MLHFLRNSKIVALAVLIVLGMIVGAAANRAHEAGRPFLPEDVVRVVIKPVQVSVSGFIRLFEVGGKRVRSRASLARENAELRAEVKRLNMEVARLREDAGEVKRLRAAVGFKQAYPEKLMAARIISRAPSEWFVTGTIDRGRKSGVEAGQAVITPRGLVGQVAEASPTSSQINALTHNQSGVGAMVQRTRAIGICKGQADSRQLHLTYLAKDADVKVGDIVVTSGQGGIVPKGLPIGRVTGVHLESGGFMKSATVRPSVHFDQTEEVFVVLRKVD